MPTVVAAPESGLSEESRRPRLGLPVRLETSGGFGAESITRGGGTSLGGGDDARTGTWIVDEHFGQLNRAPARSSPSVRRILHLGQESVIATGEFSEEAGDPQRRCDLRVCGLGVLTTRHPVKRICHLFPRCPCKGAPRTCGVPARVERKRVPVHVTGGPAKKITVPGN